MLDDEREPQNAGRPTRHRVVLTVVERGQSRGFVIAHQNGSPAYRGTGAADYACGTCGSVLAVGVHPGMFQSFVFACACGSLNAVE